MTRVTQANCPMLHAAPVGASKPTKKSKNKTIRSRKSVNEVDVYFHN
jgi:hypothetical protein